MPEPRSGDKVAPTWDYWCPPEGEHVIDPSELHVGIVHVDDQGVGHALLVLAIVPSVPVDHGLSQNEVGARLILDALRSGPWNEPDGYGAWLHAHGQTTPFPDLLPTFGADDNGSTDSRCTA